MIFLNIFDVKAVPYIVFLSRLIRLLLSWPMFLETANLCLVQYMLGPCNIFQVWKTTTQNLVDEDVRRCGLYHSSVRTKCMISLKIHN